MVLFNLPIISQYPLIITLGILVIGAILAALGGRKSSTAAVISEVFIALAFLINIILLYDIMGDPKTGFLSGPYTWLTVFNVNIGFWADGLSLPIAVMILGLSFVAILYSQIFMKDLKRPQTYYSLMMLFITSMIGTLYSTNLLQFFAFYEFMLFPSTAILIWYGTSETYEERKQNGLKFFVWTNFGALALMVGVAAIILATGSTDLLSIGWSLGTVAPELMGLVQIGSLLIVLGFAVKMAIFPLHMWAPTTYKEAPLPLLLLLSAAMTKTAAYGIARIAIPLFSPNLASYTTGLLIVSLITMYYGALAALAQKDLKMMLAYSSISQLGYLMFGYATLNLYGIEGGVFHIINHGLLMGIMFVAAGVLKMQTGTLEFSKMGGLAKKMPLTAIAFISAALALSGTPPFNAFASEWLIFEGSAAAGHIWLTIFAIIATGLTAGYYLWAVRRIFFGVTPDELAEVTDGPKPLLYVLLILTAVIVLIGIFPNSILHYIQPFLSAIIGGG